MIKNEYRSRQIRAEHEKQSFTGNNELYEMNDGNFDTNLFNHRLQSELDKLDTDAKIIFNLRFVEEMSIKQIAETMNCPEGTVKSRLFTLTKLLSKKLSIYKPELN